MKATAVLHVLVALASGAIGVPPVGTEAQVAPAAFVRIESNRVELLDSQGRQPRSIHAASVWAMRNPTMSPTGLYVALIEVSHPVVVGHNYGVPPRGTLVVLDTAGRGVRRVSSDVQRYVWMTDSQVAFVSGVYEETEMEFEATGAGIVDLRTGVIDTLPGRPRAVEWAEFDRSLYLAYPTRTDDYLIAQYDAVAREVRRTQHRGFAFSADGQFYLSYSDDGRPSLLYRTIDDQPARQTELAVLGVAVRWLPSGGSHLLVRRVPTRPTPSQAPQTPSRPRLQLNRPGQAAAEEAYTVYDVSAGQEVRQLSARFPGWGHPRGVVPFISRGRVDAIR